MQMIPHRMMTWFSLIFSAIVHLLSLIPHGLLELIGYLGIGKAPGLQAYYSPGPNLKTILAQKKPR